ncbi:transposase [Macrococcus hajekii]|uniref:Transposase n=1 Tax=Macrococcus hajekii TaxID=198482 RepID=A0A4R6BME6_9STAP|nr:helix-turn-helix domain-containing protein [Macrococcus hajekii]TDM02832.1 transposase [Macrococcus hajekii]GGB04263.1 hypothetical protein GCM10007190_10360 [Macrococcus hajekii]
MSRKFDLDFKLKLIEEYKNGTFGLTALAKKYNIDDSYIRTWIYQYDSYGLDGLISGMKRKSYSKEEKFTIIQYRLKHQLSYRETAKVFGVMNPTLIAQWQKKYNEYGILGLESKPKGRSSKTMKNKPRHISDKPLNESERQELERLRAENRQLEIAIALEKKLQSLAQENQTRK